MAEDKINTDRPKILMYHPRQSVLDLITPGNNKLEVNLPELREAITGMAENRQNFLELLSKEIKGAVVMAIEHVLDTEFTLFLGRPSEGDNKGNGTKDRTRGLQPMPFFTIQKWIF